MSRGASIALVVALALQGSPARSAPPPESNAWQALSVGADRDAAELFAQGHSSRAASLGAALASINRPPVTPSSLERAKADLTVLAGGADETSRAARYFLGRLLQLHPITPRPDLAVNEFETLVATGVDDTWCRLALIKLTILRLTILPLAADERGRFGGIEANVARTADPETRRQLHLVISEARLSRGLHDATTLTHLRAATPADVADVLRPDLLVQVGRLATELGDVDLARSCYAAFRHDYPLERRAYTVRAALERLPEPLLP